MSRSQTLWFASLASELLGLVFLFAAIPYARGGISWPLLSVAILFCVFGLALDIWRKSTPGGPQPVFDLRKNSKTVWVLFFVFMTFMTAALLYVIRGGPLTWRDARTAIFVLVCMTAYDLVVRFFRNVRTKKSSQPKVQQI